MRLLFHKHRVGKLGALLLAGVTLGKPVTMPFDLHTLIARSAFALSNETDEEVPTIKNFPF